MTETNISYQLALSGTIVWVLEQLKRSPRLAWVNADSDRINRYLSAAAAFLATLGLSYATAGNWHTGMQITITVPSLSSMGTGLMHFIGQFTLNQAVYHGVVKDSSKTQLDDIMARIDALSQKSKGAGVGQ